MSQLGSLTGRAGGATLLHEVMSFLRRCLTQVRAVVQATAGDSSVAVLLDMLLTPCGPPSCSPAVPCHWNLQMVALTSCAAFLA